jgi:hypothetical protein
MKFDEFHNGLRILTSLDRHVLEDAGVIPIGDHNAWGIFRKDPFRWFIRADDAAAHKLFELVQRRHVSGAWMSDG